jgi:hypothetical protein
LETNDITPELTDVSVLQIAAPFPLKDRGEDLGCCAAFGGATSQIFWEWSKSQVYECGRDRSGTRDVEMPSLWHFQPLIVDYI